MAMPSLACSSGLDTTDCNKCIVNQMKFNCLACGSIMKCMAKCLWGGNSRTKCMKKCDFNTGGYPRLSDCKNCLSQHKCSC